MKPSFVVAAVMVLAVAAAAGCKRTNGAYCDDARPCASGFACNLTARECSPIIGGNDMSIGDFDMAGCNCGATTPICVAMSCVSCMSTSDPDAACSAVSATTPHCAADGSCVGCRDANDCSGATPFCDATTHQCRGCIADKECTSLICDLTPDSTTHGICVDPRLVIYADAATGDDANKGLTPTTATKTVQKAENLAIMMPAHPYVHVATGSYNEAVAITGPVTLTFVGADGATIHSTMNGKDAFGVQNNAQVTIRNLIITATTGANGGNCSLGGVSFTAYHTQFINSAQVGVYSSACALKLDGCTVAGNQQGGVYIVSGDFDVKNSVIVKNNDTGFVQGLTSANTIFVNNTVADNRAGNGIAGLKCATGSTLTPVNTILYNNRDSGNTLQETDCSGAFVATDDVSAGPQSTVDLTMQPPGFVGAGDYHLVSTSPCIDEGTNSMGAPDHDYDLAPRPDATKKIWDIGAYEFQK